MNRLGELIKEYCPNGVQYQRIGDLTDYEQPGKYIVESTNYDDSFEIPVLTAGQSFILGYTDEITGVFQAYPDNPVIIFDDFTGAFKWVDFPFKVKSSAMKLLTAKEHVATLRYIYHLMGFLNYSSDEHKRLWISLYSGFQVPVPPMEVQREIVRILDSFTDHTEKLKAELASELTARKKQYEYYRDHLLERNSKTNWRECKIIDLLCQPITDGPHITPTFVSEGIPFVSAEAIYDGHIHFESKRGNITSEFDLECCKKYKPQKHDVFMVKSGSTTGKVGYVDTDERFNIWSPIAAMRVNEENSPRYLFHLLQTSNIQNQVLTKASHGSQPNLGMRALEQFDVVVPSLEEQKRIADVLDNFEAICSDLSIGLPTEIEARKLQYEYYRDLLLSFGSQFVHVEREREVTRARKPD